MFGSLANGSVWYILGEILTFCAVFVWFLAMIFSSKKKCCYLTTYVFSVCSCVWHYLGVLVWFVITHASFGGCGNFADDGKAPVLCATSGPSLAVFLMVVLPIIIVLYLVVACVAYKKGENIGIFQKIEENDPRRDRQDINPTALPYPNSIQPANPSTIFANLRPTADPRYYNTNPNITPLYNYSSGLPANLPLSSPQTFGQDNRFYQNPLTGNMNINSNNTANSKICYIFYDSNYPPDLNDTSLTFHLRPLSEMGNTSGDPNFRK